tara:strand:+ start:71 stop:220 length:150 start_codon:yes stop_codon:yes gene_type:complete
MKSEELFDELMSSVIFTPDKEFSEKVNKNNQKIEKEIPLYPEPEGEPSF